MAVPHIKIILGSTRPNRFSDKPGTWVLAELQKRGVEAEILDLRDFPLPFFNEPISPSNRTEPYTHDVVKRFTEKIKEGNAFVIVTPEYNHGIPGELKNALDWVFAEWKGKPVGFVSYGSVGGARAVEHLRGVAIELSLHPIRHAVHISRHWELKTEHGDVRPGAFEPFEKSLGTLLDELISLRTQLV